MVKIPGPAVDPLAILVEGRRLLLSPGERFTIGRDVGCDLVLNHPLVSRHHASITYYEESSVWILSDEASRYGIYVGNERCEQVVMTAAVAIRIGDPEVGLVLEIESEELDVNSSGGSDEVLGRLVGLHDAGSQKMLSIGRDPDSDLFVDDLTISRRHAEIRRRSDGSLEIVDLDSSNGTFVNGQRIKGALLEEFDIVQVGDHTFRLANGEFEAYADDGKAEFLAKDLSFVTADGVTLLDQVTFRLGGRSLLAVVGPSGAGKSTLLGALTGDRPATTGNLHYGSRDLYEEYDALRSRIGFVPQDDVVHRELSVDEELRHAAALRFAPDTTEEERAQRIDEVIDELGLGGVRTYRISRLSGGQRKRVSVAIELLTRPALLFLDEPTSGLDPGIERSMMTLLRKLADGDRIVVVITHSVQSIRICDRLLILAPGGSPAYFGPPQLAAAYFESVDIEDVFQLLSGNPTGDWRARFEASPIFREYVGWAAGDEAKRGTIVGPRSIAPRSRRRQLGTLIRRDLLILRADRRNLIILLAQGPILGLVMLLALPTGQFDRPGPLELRFTSQAALVLLMLVLGSTWLGAITAVREIVKDFAMVQRERAAGLSIGAYVMSKVLVLGTVTVIGSALLVIIASARQSGPDQAVVLGWPLGELALVIALTGLAAMAQGLLLSSAVTTVDQAMSLLPILLIIQMVLAVGAVFPDVTDTPGLAQAQVVSSANWGMASGSSTIDLNELQGLTIALSDLPPLDLARPQETFEALVATGASIVDAGEARFEPSVRTWAVNTGALAAITLGSVLATGLVLRRRLRV